MRKTYLRLGALLLMCASGMNSFAVDFKDYKFTVGDCMYQVTENDPTPGDEPKKTFGKVILVSVTKDATDLDYSSEKSKSVVTDAPNHCEYQVVGIVGAKVEKDEKGKYIKDGAFKGAEALTTITLGKQMKEIGDNAFSFLGNSVEIKFEKGAQLEKIGKEAFKSYPGVKTVKITPASGELLDLTKATTLDEGAFEGVEFTSGGVKFGDITKVPNKLFKNASGLATVEFANPKGLERIGDEAFNGATGIKKFGCPDNGAYFLPSTLNEVGKSAFTAALTENGLQFAFSNFANAQITNVGESAFEDCTAIDDKKFKSLFKGFEGLTYGESAFAGCGLIEELDLSDGGNEIPIGAFKDNDLKKVTFPDGLKTIGAEAFMNNNKLGAKDDDGKENPILIPSSVTKIGRYAFKRNTEAAPTAAEDDLKTATDTVAKLKANNEAYKQIYKGDSKPEFSSLTEPTSVADYNNLKKNYFSDAVMSDFVSKVEKYVEVLTYLQQYLPATNASLINANKYLGYVKANIESIKTTLKTKATASNYETLYTDLNNNYKSLKTNWNFIHTKGLNAVFNTDYTANVYDTELENLNVDVNTYQTALNTAQAATPARKIYILPAETQEGRTKQAVVQCTYNVKVGDKLETQAGSPIDTYDNTTLYVPMGLQKKYFSGEEKAHAWNVPEGKLFTYGQELNAGKDIYDGAFKYQVTEKWDPQYSNAPGYSESPVVKLVGINKDNTYSGYTATLYKYTDGKKQNIAEDFDLVVPDTIGQSKEKIYVYYTVAGIGKTMAEMVGEYNTDKVKSAKIEAGVTELIAGLFKGCKNLKEFAIPASVTTIGANAFAGTNLQSIDIPASVQTIGANAFDGYGKLDEGVYKFVGVRTFHLNWTSKPAGIDENAFGGVVSYYDLEQREIYLPRYAVMETNDALLAFTTGEGYGKPFNNKNKFQVGEGIAIQYANGNPEFLNVGVTSTGGTTTRTLAFKDANDIVKLEVSKNIQAEVTYTRDFKSTNLQAWYVPFELKADQKQGAKFYKIYDTKVVEGTDGNPVTSLELVEEKGDIKANVPYLVKPAEAKETPFSALGLVANGAGAGKSVKVADVENTYTISGIYEEKKPEVDKNGKITKGFYGLNGGSFKSATAKASMKACRIIMTSDKNPESPYVKLHIMGDEEDETAILNLETGEVSSEAMYDLSGRRISAPVKGQIYIKGNVKKLAR